MILVNGPFNNANFELHGLYSSFNQRGVTIGERGIDLGVTGVLFLALELAADPCTLRIIVDPLRCGLGFTGVILGVSFVGPVPAWRSRGRVR